MNEIEELYNEMNNAIADCDDCRDCEFYYDVGDCQNKRIAKALIGLGYRKQEVKTNGDYIRMYGKSDEDLAHDKIVIYGHWEDDQIVSEFSAEFAHKTFDEYYKAYNANLEWLKQEHKGE